MYIMYIFVYASQKPVAMLPPPHKSQLTLGLSSRHEKLRHRRHNRPTTMLRK